VPIPHIDGVPDDPEWTSGRGAHEPHYDLASAYRVGDWREACVERGRPRDGDPDELLRYLLAWCEATTRGPTATRDAIIALTRSRSLSLAEATRADVAALAAELEPTMAIQWLATQRVTTLDTLAAAYHADGRDGQALHVLAYLEEHEPDAPILVHCRRIQRSMSMGVWPMNRDAIRVADDARCAPRLVPVRCLPATGAWAATPTGCDAACALSAIKADFTRCNEPGLRQQVLAASARLHWPRAEQTFDGWFRLANFLHQWPWPSVVKLAEAASANALRASTCTPTQLARLAHIGRHETVESCRRAQP